MASEDLKRYLQREAEIYDDCTIHPSERRNRVTGVLEKTERKWVRTKILGEGAYGQVWHEQNTSHGRQRARAVKIIRKGQLKSQGVDYSKELLALATFSKEEYRQAGVLVTFLNWFENEHSIFLAMEYFPHGDLAAHISSISNEDEVRQITTDLLEGLKIMHREGFAHRDLKPQNIFVVEKTPSSARWWVKIGDFGISKRVRNNATALRTDTGTEQFRAPETLGFMSHDGETSEYDISVDIWSLGCVVYDISAQRVPFPTRHDVKKFCQRRSQLPKEPLFRILSEAGIEFIARMLVPEPPLRMTVGQGLQNPWILNVSTTPQFQNDAVVGNTQQDLATMLSKTAISSRSERTQHGGSYVIGSNLVGDAVMNTAIRNPHAMSAGPDRTATPPTPRQSNLTSAPPSQPESLITRIPQTERTGDIDQRPQNVPESLRPQYRKPVFPQEPLTSSDAFSGSMSSGSQPVLMAPQLTTNPDVDWDKSKVLTGHSEMVTAVAFSPNGTIVASGSMDSTIRFWNIATGQPYRQLGNGSTPGHIAFSPDGTLFASGSGYNMVRIWDLATGQVYRELSGYDGWTVNVAFSPEGTLLASGSEDKTVRIWNIVTGQVDLELSGHRDRVVGVAFSPDGTLLASGSDDKTVRIWSIATGRVYRELLGHSGTVLTVAFSSDGTLLASGSWDNTVRLWSTATGQVYRELLGHKDHVRGVAFSPDGSLLASGSEDNKVRLWDIATGVVYRELSGHASWVVDVAFSPDGSSLASASSDCTVRLWGAEQVQRAESPDLAESPGRAERRRRAESLERAVERAEHARRTAEQAQRTESPVEITKEQAQAMIAMKLRADRDRKWRAQHAQDRQRSESARPTEFADSAKSLWNAVLPSRAAHRRSRGRERAWSSGSEYDEYYSDDTFTPYKKSNWKDSLKRFIS